MSDKLINGSTPVSAGEIETVLEAAQNLLRQQDFAGAADLSQAVLKSRPTNGTAWFLLCHSLIQMQSVDAERALRQARAALPKTDVAWLFLTVELCRILGEQASGDEVVEIAAEAREFSNLTPIQHHSLSTALSISSRFEDALMHADEAVKAKPDFTAARHNRGMVLRNLGRLDDAEADFEFVLAQMPTNGLAHAALADLRKWGPSNNHVQRLETLLASHRLPDEDKTRLLYALFKEANDLGDREKAWPALRDSTAISARLNPDAPDRRAEWTDMMIRQFTGNLSAPAPFPNVEATPIFIVGLPRSGTTLVERIFAAHPDVTPMGETHGLQKAIREALDVPRLGKFDVDALVKLPGTNWANVRSSYLRSCRHLRGSTAYFTEKLPQNYTLVGIARRAFPEAKIIHLRRSPMDSLFGAFRVLFAPDSYTWSYTFDGLRQNYSEYRRLTDHWRREIGPAFIDVILEKLIDDPEPTIRDLMERSGVGFANACLNPHEVDGGVSTASSTQVRQPINRQGVDAWRKYSEHLEPLRAMLEADGFVDGHGNAIWS